MDAFPLDAFFEWIQQVIEKRWGKVWAWTVFTALLLLFVGGAIWFVFELEARQRRSLTAAFHPSRTLT